MEKLTHEYVLSIMDDYRKIVNSYRDALKEVEETKNKLKGANDSIWYYMRKANLLEEQFDEDELVRMYTEAGIQRNIF